MKSPLLGTTVFLLVLVGAVAGAAAQQQPTLSLDPSSGLAGTTTTASGGGFVASPCGVNLYLDSVSGPLPGSALLDQGSLSPGIAFPQDASEGVHNVVAQGQTFAGEFCGAPSDETASARFTVLGAGAVVGGPVTPVLLDLDLRTLPPASPATGDEP